jgi:hypothetical protein
MMERTGILAGKCYRGVDGIVYEVIAYDGQNVRFRVRGRAESRAAMGEASEPWETFLQRLQGEVDCPDA